MNVSERNKKIALARWKNKHSKERQKIRTDEETLLLKASICGFLAGDGSVQKRKAKSFYHCQIDFFPDDALMKDTYLSQMRKVYEKIPLVQKKNKHYIIRLSSKVIVEDLMNIANFGLKKWTLPKSLLFIKGAKENWLKAFFSAEAYVSSNSIKIQTVNKKGMQEVSKILQGLGIATKSYEYQPKKENHSLVSIIFINKKEDRLKFFNKIGFWHEKKTKILKESLGL